MSNNRPSNNSPFNFGPGKKIPLDIGNFGGEEKSVKDMLKEIGQQLLPMVAMVKMDPMFGMMLEAQIAEGFQRANDSLFMGEASLKIDEISSQIRSLSRNDISEGLNKLLQSNDDPAASREMTRKMKLQVMDMAEDEAVALYKARVSLTPPAVRFFEEIADGKSAEDFARDMHRKYSTLSVDELIRDKEAMIAKLPREAIVEAIYEMTQKATPDAIETLAKEMLIRTSPEQVAGVVMGIVGVVEDGLKTVISENRIGVKDAAAASSAGDKIEKFFVSLQESFNAAGIVPDTDLKAEFKAVYGSKNGQTPPPPAQNGQGKRPTPPKGPKLG